MKIYKRTVVALALSTLAVTTTLALSVAVLAENDYEHNSIATVEQIQSKEILNDTTLNRPEFSYTIYNAAVLYTWNADPNADALAMYPSYNIYVYPDVYETTTYKEVSYANVGSKDCVSHYVMGASYDTKTKTYSDKYDMEWAEEKNGYQVMRYGYDSKYKIIGKLDHAKVSGNVPTDYDKANFIWDHKAKNFHKIKGTISYNGYVTNIEVEVPWIGYNTKSVKLDGVTFSLRTGPWKCSIKANKKISAFDVGFGFGIT